MAKNKRDISEARKEYIREQIRQMIIELAHLGYATMIDDMDLSKKAKAYAKTLDLKMVERNNRRQKQ